MKTLNDLIRELHAFQLEVQFAQPRNQRGVSHFGNAIKSIDAAKQSLILASRKEDDECASQSSASLRASSQKGESATSSTTDAATASNGRVATTTIPSLTPKESFNSVGKETLTE